MAKLTKEKLAKMIDAGLVYTDATKETIIQGCKEAKKLKLNSVFVPGYYVKLAKQMLKGSGVKVLCAAGFPYGHCLPEVKALEAKRGVEDGAEEVDMCINVGALKDGDYELVEKDMAGVVKAAKEAGGDTIITKVIIHAQLLTDTEKRIACKLAQEAGIDFIKTCAGNDDRDRPFFEDVKFLRKVMDRNMGLKVSSGGMTWQPMGKDGGAFPTPLPPNVDTIVNVLRMIDLGANHFGMHMLGAKAVLESLDVLEKWVAEGKLG